MVLEIGLMEVAEFTIAAIVMGLCVGYFIFIRPKKKAQKAEEEYQAKPIEEQKPLSQVPMSELPVTQADAAMNDALREKEGE